MRRVTLATFRRMSAAEESMIRASMPRTSAVDPSRSPSEAVDFTAHVDRSVNVRPLTATMAEVARA